MESLSQKESLINEMAKILFFSLKTLFVLCSAWMTVPFSEMVDQFTAQSPPVFLFYFFNALLFSHEIVMGVSASSRKWVNKALEDDKGKLDSKQLLASYLSLWCIRLFVHGKLVEVYFPETGGFDDKTYYYLIVIIMILVGGVVLEKGLSTILKKIFK